jgi:hypothetical protein
MTQQAQRLFNSKAGSKAYREMEYESRLEASILPESPQDCCVSWEALKKLL